MSGLRVCICLFLIASFCFRMSFVFGVEGDEAWAAIDRADSAVASVYEAVLEAEEVGANVSGLLEKLNFGAEALAKANVLYRVGDFDGAVYFADLCYDEVVDLTGEANGLRDLAVVERRERLFLTLVASTLGVDFAVFGGVFGWRLFKRRYFQRVLKMKPSLNRKRNVLEKDS